MIKSTWNVFENFYNVISADGKVLYHISNKENNECVYRFNTVTYEHEVADFETEGGHINGMFYNADEMASLFAEIETLEWIKLYGEDDNAESYVYGLTDTNRITRVLDTITGSSLLTDSNTFVFRMPGYGIMYKNECGDIKYQWGLSTDEVNINSLVYATPDKANEINEMNKELFSKFL